MYRYCRSRITQRDSKIKPRRKKRKRVAKRKIGLVHLLFIQMKISLDSVERFVYANNSSSFSVLRRLAFLGNNFNYAGNGKFARRFSEVDISLA